MVQEFFMELTVVIIVATILGIIFSKLKQPVILAFIVTGIVLGASFLNAITYSELLNIFSELGIAFLLFLVGISLDLRILKEIGKTSIITGIGQIVFTTVIGFIIATFFGFGFIEALYISVALTFSSTIIIVKLLTDKKELNSLYGKISVGFLLVQDFVAIIALILISAISFSTNFSQQITLFFTNIIIMIILFYLATKFVVRKFFDYLSNDQDLLFLGSIAWCFFFTAIAIYLGFSKEIGAFVAGVTIASLPYTHEILGKLKYLRDFFLVLFFVVLGSSLVFTSTDLVLGPAVVFTLFVLIGNPIIVFLLMLFLGYKGRTSFLASLTVAQISEFSLIIIFLGQKVGHLSNEVVSIITLVGVLTISLSTYMIIYNNQIYNFISGKLPILRTKRFFEDSLHKTKEKKYDVVCIGFGETGRRIFLESHFKKRDVLIIDFNPGSMEEATKRGFDFYYGDASDLETIEKILISKPRIVVSTIMDVLSNITLTRKLYSKDKKLSLIVLAHTPKDAKKLFKEKIEFVLVPTTIAAGKIRTILSDLKSKKTFELNWLKEFDE